MFKELFCSHLIFFFYQICRYYVSKRLFGTLRDVSERENVYAAKQTFAFESTVTSRRNSIILFEEEYYYYSQLIIHHATVAADEANSVELKFHWSTQKKCLSWRKQQVSFSVSNWRRARRRKLIPDERRTRRERRIRKPSADSEMMTYILLQSENPFTLVLFY